MFQKLLSRILEPRHFWRNAGFDELSELYASQLLRSLGISLIGLFTPIYLYKIGYALSEVALFHVFWFLLRPFFDFSAAFIVAKIGPKHTMLLSNFIYIIYLGLLISIEELRWPLILVAGFGSFAYGLHLLATAVDFSKIKHSEHGGKELGYMDIVQKCGGIIGPLIGGLLANYADPRYAVGLAMLVVLCSAVPLFFTSETVKTNQHITFRGLPFRVRKRDYISVASFTVESTISLIAWPLYAAVFILGDNTFAKLGIIAALSTASSLFLSRVIGGVIDKNKGRKLLRISIMLNALLHIARIFIRSVVGVGLVNMANEPITASYRMPFLKGIYDAADSLPGYRIAYLASLSMIDALSRLVVWVVIYAGLMILDSPSVVFQAMFIVAFVGSIGILLERFEALDEK